MSELFITGLGSYLPRRMVGNQELAALQPERTLEEIDRVGIRRRGWAGDDEGVLEMALNASRQALAESGVAADMLDFLILANWTERRYVPDFAPRIQQALGAERAFAFDVCCACSGFLFALSMAHGYLQNPRFSRGLVLASDRSSQRMRPGSRATLVFGDGAAAAVVERDAGRGGKLIDYELRTDGSRGDIMEIAVDGYLQAHIKQRDLNDLAGRSIAQVCRALLERNGLSLADVDWIIPHSGTPGVQLMVAEHLRAPAEKVLTNLVDVGNVTAASIPTALHHFKQTGLIKAGSLILSASVGLGWQYAGALYTS
ncbi:MAG TPA: ketoacyl-ACP synthase III [Polyangiaceae bacterium]|nr:ketoacyl-ACP synthase III [Polyangiaceae bacterium]